MGNISHIVTKESRGDLLKTPSEMWGGGKEQILVEIAPRNIGQFPWQQDALIRKKRDSVQRTSRSADHIAIFQ